MRVSLGAASSGWSARESRSKISRQPSSPARKKKECRCEQAASRGLSVRERRRFAVDAAPKKQRVFGV